MTAGSSEYGSIGPYKIVRRLGFGRKSEVLLATRMFPGNFERRVVIKRLLAKCEDEPERQAVLAAEALAYARVAHPAIVNLFDFFAHEGHLALVLEYVDGLSLAKFLEGLRTRREPLSDGVALFVASRVFAGLAAAHSAKDPRTGEITPVIHRDVSPANVLIPWDGFVKLGDFDLSKVIGVSGDTRAGLMKGTYGYMAPEQVTGDPVTQRTDVYAGCLVLRELLLGRPAFDEHMPELELLTSMLETRLAPIETLRHGIPRRLAVALSCGLSRDPAERTVSAGEMVELLRSLADMELAHAELISRLERVRPIEERGLVSQSAKTVPGGVPTPSSSGFPSSRSRWSFHTGRGVTLPAAESLPPIEQGSQRPPRPERTVSAAAVLTAFGVLGLVFAVASSLHSATPEAFSEVAASAPPSAAAPSPPAPIAPPAVTPPSSADRAVHAVNANAQPPLPVTVPNYGTLVPPPSARHHRVWVDGEVAVWAPGPELRVPCGPHVVRIGSAGASQSIDVACGARITLGAK
jgi:eukaryotic-like serine/threonine-protein kinase